MSPFYMLVALAGVVWRTKVLPYAARYTYTREHSARAVKRSIRHQVGNISVVRAAYISGYAERMGYAARMSYIARHTGEVFA